MSFLMTGLQNEIGLVMRMFRPRTLAELYGLCKLEEAKLGAMKQKQKMTLFPTARFLNTNTISGLKPLALPTPNANWRNKASTFQNGPFRKQLTQKEFEEKRIKGLCFYDDQKYVPGHKCSGQVYCLEVIVYDSHAEAGEEV
ncbi:hypothetical protein Tco_0290073 [Tanacetum coccineum]